MIECISNAGHSIINHKSTGTFPSRAIIWCHADSCPPSPPESNNVSFDGIFSCPSVVRIMGIFYHVLIGLIRFYSPFLVFYEMDIRTWKYIFSKYLHPGKYINRRRWTLCRTYVHQRTNGYWKVK